MQGLAHLHYHHCVTPIPPNSSAPTIRPAPTLLTATPIAFANNPRHEVDRPAFDAGTSFGTAGRDGGHSPFRFLLGQRQVWVLAIHDLAPKLQ